MDTRAQLVGLGLLVMGCLVFSAVAHCETCTDGVDCFCDSATVTGDAQRLLCEDFEDPAYYDGSTHNWVAGGTARGSNSAYFLKWGNGESKMLWANGAPASPRVGSTCASETGRCVGAMEYCSAAQGAVVDGGSADCWNANSETYTELDVQRGDDYKAEIGTLTLTGGQGASAAIGDGKQSMAYRVAAGATAGGNNMINWNCGGGHCTELGVTQLRAYSSNVGNTSIWSAAWKDTEYGYGAPRGGSWWIMGRVQSGFSNALRYPFENFMWMSSEADCLNVMASGTVLAGSWGCYGTGSQWGFDYGADVAAFNQATDFPWGTWHCVEAHIKGMGTINGEIEIKNDGVDVVHFTGMNMTQMENQYFDGMRLDYYSNANQGDGNDGPTNVTVYRYEDNIYIRNGPPLSCAQIGFDVSNPDNCSAVANPDQCDTDHDGYGNACDGDFDNDYSVFTSDYDTFMADLQSGQDSGVGTDMDCDGYVLTSDYDIFYGYLDGSGSPGPSGLSCAGVTPCP